MRSLTTAAFGRSGLCEGTPRIGLECDDDMLMVNATDSMDACNAANGLGSLTCGHLGTCL